MAAAGETPLAADGTSAGGTPTVAGGLQEGQGSGGRSLMVQVIGARRLRAADSNGFSDPYCVVRVGPHKAASKTELKTLCPRWNET